MNEGVTVQANGLNTAGAGSNNGPLGFPEGDFPMFPPSASSAYNPSPFTSIRYSASNRAKGVATPGPSRPPSERGHPHFCDDYKKVTGPTPSREIGQRPPTRHSQRRRRCALQPGITPDMRTDCPSTPTALRPKAWRYPGYEDGLPFNAEGVVPQSPALPRV
jgi:hypothetical protein